MKAIFPISVILLISCQQKPRDEVRIQVKAVAETEAVSADAETDAADDPAIWYNADEPERSMIIGSDKTNGIDIFSLDGKRLETYLAGRINNVDVRYGFPWKDGLIDIVGGSNRSSNTLDFWRVVPDSMRLVFLGSIPTDMPDVYGFCLYKSPISEQVYAYINSKSGKVEQWKLREEKGKIMADMVRKLQLGSQVEGMVADDSLKVLFVGEEGKGIFRFDAEENGSTEGQFIDKSGESNTDIKYDIEGLSIYYLQEGNGYLIASSQGNYSYAVFERSGKNAYVGSFEIGDGTVDGVQETDGLDICHHALGMAYPSGVFVCQDGYNFDGETKVAQNFKMVHWADIANAFDPPLKVFGEDLKRRQ